MTPSASDPRFSQPHIDVREWRDTPVRHQYVHGGFRDTDARFSFYFPPEDSYGGRFYQRTHQLFFSEEAEPHNIGMAFAAGAYFVQTNMGGSEYPRRAEEALSGNSDPSIGGYRVNAAAARFSRDVAEGIFGPGRIYGYLFGGSGGAHQTIAASEVTEGVWDGFLPCVMGTPNAIPNVFTVRVHALQVLKDKWPSIFDAIEPGGSGDPYGDLNEEQRGALEEATALGFPLQAWFNYMPVGGGPLGLVAGYVPIADPTYFEDFWAEPGYLGTDPGSSIRTARVQEETELVTVLGGPPVRLELASVPAGDLTGGDLTILSGAAEGRAITIGAVVGNTVALGLGSDPTVPDALRPGDRVRIDNSNYLALETYHRHQVPPLGGDHDYPGVYDYLRNADGTPKYPQREIRVGPLGAFNAAGEINNGDFRGKMIVVENLLDGDALPWQADWYRTRVQAAVGEHIDDSFRLWFIDNAQHTNSLSTEQLRHVVTYQGVLEQGLRDLSAWVERGVAPPASSAYEVVGGQVEVPTTAKERRGIQPVVSLKVNGGFRAHTVVGEQVSLAAHIEVPPNTGTVVAADWDFVGDGTYQVPADLDDTTATEVDVTATYSFPAPGTYFPALRVMSHREGDPDTPYARVQNLARVRVVVQQGAQSFVA